MHERQECIHGVVVTSCRCIAGAHNIKIVSCPEYCANYAGGLVQNLEIETALLRDIIMNADSEEFTEGYVFVEDIMTGEWRWGVERRAVIKDLSNRFWAVDYRESVGDEYYNSLDDEGSSVDMYPVAPRVETIIRYERINNDF